VPSNGGLSAVVLSQAGATSGCCHGRVRDKPLNALNAQDQLNARLAKASTATSWGWSDWDKTRQDNACGTRAADLHDTALTSGLLNEWNNKPAVEIAGLHELMNKNSVEICTMEECCASAKQVLDNSLLGNEGGNF